jgi:hypothetical protein
MPARLDFAADYSQIIEAVKERLKPDLSDLSEIIAKEERLDPNFDRGQFIDNAIAQRKRNCYPAAIVLDTLNRSFIGSESNDEDMTAYIRAADALKNEFECAVIIVHHSGHDASRPRGHSSLTAAIDAQLSVKRSPDDHVIVEVEWMRDGPEGERVVSRLKQVQVGTDTAGDPITSCVAVASDDLPAIAVASSRLKAALQALDTVAGPDGAAETAVWRHEMRRQGVITNRGNPRSAFKRIKDNLIETKQITEENGIVRRSNRTVPGCVPSVPFIGGRDGGTLTPRPDGTPGDGTRQWDAKREAA